LIFGTTADGAQDGTERMRIGSDGLVTLPDAGGLVVGHTAQLAAGEATAETQIVGTVTNGDGALLIYVANTTNTHTPSIRFVKNANATIGTNSTAVADDEEIVVIRGYGTDGTDADTLIGELRLEVDDGSPGTGAIGGAWVALTAATDGTRTEAVRIDSSQNTTFSGIVKTDDGTDATSGTDGSLQTDGGLSVVKDAYFGAVSIFSDGTDALYADRYNLSFNRDPSSGAIANSSAHSYVFHHSARSATPASDRLHLNIYDEGGSVVTNDGLVIDGNGTVFIGDTANAQMTQGLTINQGAADDQAISLKSSDVAHGLTSAGYAVQETDTYLSMRKQDLNNGGVQISSFMQNVAAANTLVFDSHGGQATTTKATNSTGLVNFRVLQHNGSNALANVTANGNVFTVQAQTGGALVTRILVDEDGDLYSVTSAQTFDDYDDVALIEAYDHVRSGDAKFQIKAEFGKFAKINEAALIEAGVLGAPIAEGGMTNQTQLIRVLTGAARQQAERIRQLETTVAGLLPAGD
jgi:hypothetical protein